jgi:hypothetical protein
MAKDKYRMDWLVEHEGSLIAYRERGEDGVVRTLWQVVIKGRAASALPSTSPRGAIDAAKTQRERS